MMADAWNLCHLTWIKTLTWAWEKYSKRQVEVTKIYIFSAVPRPLHTTCTCRCSAIWKWVASLSHLHTCTNITCTMNMATLVWGLRLTVSAASKQWSTTHPCSWAPAQTDDDDDARSTHPCPSTRGRWRWWGWARTAWRRWTRPGSSSPSVRWTRWSASGWLKHRTVALQKYM